MICRVLLLSAVGVCIARSGGGVSESFAVRKITYGAGVERVFPLLAPLGEVESWAGLRPATPNNVPLIGGTRLRNLYLNTGHGTLGWTLACGSGRALPALVSGRRPQVAHRLAGRRFPPGRRARQSVRRRGRHRSRAGAQVGPGGRRYFRGRGDGNCAVPCSREDLS